MWKPKKNGGKLLKTKDKLKEHEWAMKKTEAKPKNLVEKQIKNEREKTWKL